MAPVDQLLFGYRDGHELIAGSRELSPAQLRDVLRHTDASIGGAEPPELVGTWIDSLDRYVLARIWPAPERPRPGAVWAHALLIADRELRSAPLTGLPGLLLRPAGDGFDRYRTPLPWPRPVELAPLTRPLGQALVWVALDGGAPAGAVLWDEPTAGEDALIAMLDVMPPTARRRLSFRTGARLRPGSYSVVVTSQLGGRAQNDGCAVIDARQAPPAPPPDWTNLLEPNDIGARQRAFLRRFGQGEDCNPRDVSALIGLAELIEAGVPASLVIEALIRNFPEPHQVHNLRAALLGTSSVTSGLWAVGEEARLDLLLEHQHHFDVLGLGLRERLAALTETDPPAVIRLVDRRRTAGKVG
jgi:hypothetical protein